MVQLDVQGATDVVDRYGSVEPSVRDPKVVQMSQRDPGEVAELGVMTFAFELGDDHDREHDVVLREPAQRVGIAEQDRGVDDVGAAV